MVEDASFEYAPGDNIILSVDLINLSRIFELQFYLGKWTWVSSIYVQAVSLDQIAYDLDFK